MNIETTLAEMRASYDWKEAFVYAALQPTEGYKGPLGSFGFDDVAELLASSEGENYERDWIAAFRLNDGRYAFLSAGCDYTGWDCQAGGSAWAAEDLERLVQFGMSEEQRTRLGVTL